MASAKVDGMKYLLLLLRPCCLARSNCRDRFALGAARARPPGVFDQAMVCLFAFKYCRNC